MSAGVVTHLLAARGPRYSAAGLLGIAVALTMFGYPWDSPLIPYRMDLEVYWLGGRVLLDGGELYGQLPPLTDGSHLPFTYPPLAAMLFVPLALVPLTPATVIHTLGTTLALTTVTYAVLSRTPGVRTPGVRGLDRSVVWPAMAVTALGLASGPLRETVGYGQINVLLMALVVVDCLCGRGRWWGGSLVGLAAAIKLTPATMVVYFVIRGDWRSLVTALVSAVGVTGLAHLVAPGESTRYWTSMLSEPGRIGRLEFASNQSINGVLHRLGLSGGEASLVWFGVSAVLGLTIACAARLLVRRGEDTPAAILVAFIALLCSPVAWGHHWVWAVPMLIVVTAWAVTSGDRLWTWLAGSGAVVFVATPQWWFATDDGRELGWTLPEHLIGNSYLVWTLALVAAIVLRSSPSGRAASHHEPMRKSRPRRDLWRTKPAVHRSEAGLSAEPIGLDDVGHGLLLRRRRRRPRPVE